MTITWYFILGLLIHHVQCLPNISSDNANFDKTQEMERNFDNSTFSDLGLEMTSVVSPTTGMIEPTNSVVQPATIVVETADSVIKPTNSVVEPITAINDGDVVSEVRNESEKDGRLIEQDDIKEDDKSGTLDIPVDDSGGDAVIADNSGGITGTKESDNITRIATTTTTSTTLPPPFSPSPYLGTVIEEVIEEPIADSRNSVQTNFIPMKSRQSFNSFTEDAPSSRQYPSFYTVSTIVPVLGDSYSLHSNNAINEDFDNPNFNDNPYGRIKFPEEKSKYFPLFLDENEISNQDKPLKFDHDGNYKQYDFPYKIEGAGHENNMFEFQNEPQISDKTNLNILNRNLKNGDHNVHGTEIMQNVSTALPLETKKNFPTKYQHTAWKKVAHTVMAFLPIGLMLAAIPPRVVKVNATSHYPARQEVPPAPNAVNRYFKENVNSRQAL